MKWFRCNNLTVLWKCCPGMLQINVPQKPLWMQEGIIIGVIFHLLECMCLTKVFGALATSHSSALINMMSLIQWTNVMFCIMFRWFVQALQIILWCRMRELTWPWDKNANVGCYAFYMNTKYFWLPLIGMKTIHYSDQSPYIMYLKQCALL